MKNPTKMVAYPSLLVLNERLLKAAADDGGKVTIELTDKERIAVMDAVNGIHEEVTAAREYANRAEGSVLDMFIASVAPQVHRTFLDSGEKDPEAIGMATVNFALGVMKARTEYIAAQVEKLTYTGPDDAEDDGKVVDIKSKGDGDGE